MFLPTTIEEMRQRGWHRLDVILVTGDAYIDSPHVGVAVIGRVLEAEGFRVGVIPQPDPGHPEEIARLGEPALFWGVTGGCIDSLVANRTSSGRHRWQDDYTPGGRNELRPDRATIVYANLIRRLFKPCKPIVLGGIEASLRRVAHYDFWDNRLRRSLLLDAKADLLVYGMGEKAVVELARNVAAGREVNTIRGVCHIAGTPPADYLRLPSWERVTADRDAFADMFRRFAANCDPVTARGLVQPYGNRWLVHNPPQPPLEGEALDRVYALGYERAPHPRHAADGPVRALDTIRFSITSHRGCYGDCSFCAIAMHQGRGVQWRSRESILAEAVGITRMNDFRGVITDVGGPSANMYGFDCRRRCRKGSCPDRRCLYPQVCPSLQPDHDRQIRLLEALRALPGVKKVFVASGIRPDLVLADRENGDRYLAQLARYHVSGQLKVAPEHVSPGVLAQMGKPGVEGLLAFRDRFLNHSRAAGKRQFLTYYFMAAHPGCTFEDMQRLRDFALRELKLTPEQVQIFTPTPSTRAALAYYTGVDPETGAPLFVEKDPLQKERQKHTLVAPAARGRGRRKGAGGGRRQRRQ